MRKLRHIAKMACMVLLPMLTVSCGLIDMELDDGEVQEEFEMKLTHDKVHVFVGDSFFVQPVFIPDSVANKEVFLQVESEDIVRNVNDTLVAVGVGDTQILFVSVEGAKTAYCDVMVLDTWALNSNTFSDDMVVYANVTVNGKPFDPETMEIAALAGSEFRGSGNIIEVGGRECIQFRVYSYMEWGTDEPTQPEEIRFAIYDKQNLSLEYLPWAVPFDGETHGSLSEPLEMNF